MLNGLVYLVFCDSRVGCNRDAFQSLPFTFHRHKRPHVSLQFLRERAHQNTPFQNLGIREPFEIERFANVHVATERTLVHG